MAYQRYSGFQKVLGVLKDRPPSEVPNQFWSEADNIKFSNGAAMACDGHGQVFSGNTEAPNWGIARVESGTPYWYYGSDTKISRTEGTSHSDVTRTVGGNYTSGAWNGTGLNGVLVFNNGVDQLQVFEPGDSNFKDSANFPATLKAKVVRSFKNYLFALNLTESSVEKPYTLRWSDAADPGLEPGSWDITDQTVDAGQVPLADTVGEIVDGLTLRDQFMIYKTDAVYSAQFIGGAFIFSFRKIFDKWGMLSTNCAANFNGKHFVVGLDDIYVHDGVRQTSVSDQRVRDFFYADINSDYIENVHVAPNYNSDEMWVCYPSNATGNAGECDRALVYNWTEDTWAPRDIPDTSFATFGIVDPQQVEDWDAGESGSWDTAALVWNSGTYNPSKNSLLLMSKTNSKFYSVGSTTDFDGTSFNWSLEKASMDLENQFDFKHVNAMLPKLVGDGSVTISVGTQDRIGDGINWSSPVTFDPNSDVRAYFRKSGRYLSFKFEGSSDTNFKLVGFELEGATLGER